jgi:uncharacterized damage-inducible protein DinB
VALVNNMSEEDMNNNVAWLVQPRTMGQVRVIDWLWFMTSDMIHHRGQFSVYIRIAGGITPSIYGPTAEDNWM